MARRNHFKNAAQRSYRSRNQNNPYFQKKRNIPTKPLLAIVGCLMFLMIGTFFLLSSSRFEIHNIEVTGIEHIDVSEIEAVIQDYFTSPALIFWKKSNMFLFDGSELADAISEQFTFADVSISSSGQSLFLDVVERTSNLLWKVGESYYVVDLEGVVVRQLSNEEMDILLNQEQTGNIVEDLPIFIDKNNISISVGESVLTEEEISGVFVFHDELLAQSIDFTQTTFDRLAGKWVSVSTTKGFEILFDPTADVRAQASRLREVLATEAEGIDDLEYVDLRFGDHVYYQ